MFTGLIAAVGTVRSAEHGPGGARFEITAPEIAADLQSGDSVSVSGCCLTATEVGEETFRCDAMEETLERTALAGLGRGERVNLELPLRLEDRLGGHLVQGHVDATGEVTDVAEEGFARRLRIAAPEQLLRYVVPKGSVTIDGVSLTVASTDEAGFSVALIPETLERTTLGQAGPGRRVNLEADVLAKYVERLLASVAA